MQLASEEIERLFGNRVRLRVCGICIENNQILLASHNLFSPEKPFWIPPGGGVEFGENAVTALRREFAEETGLDVEVGELMFINEHIAPPLHAVELFFKVTRKEGKLLKGADPELGAEKQIISNVRFAGWDFLENLPADQKHAIFSIAHSLDELTSLGPFISNADRSDLD